ncbi:MAG: bifunctional folylpolyglutamate synthase/dihydrofolate synthase [Bacteroidaceae bacterium]|nr:bifunctional folylpolyglutamate synthase/dihydrofolate synthase [Bacteroidaceae bacterium]
MNRGWEEALQYLYSAVPMFQNIGAGAYKEGLATTRALDEHFGHPHRRYRTIHVAGTNGKGSVSSTLAAILQSAGLRVGLYTSPHLVDFRERIRVDGEMIPEQRVIDFVEQERVFFEPLSPSFFELTTALAFLYFAEQQVDVAVVEVGLGGRLDCTNIICPDLSIITNISFDHQQFLGDTLAKIAAEKAGIIKEGVPVVIGETNGHADVRDVFIRVFGEKNVALSILPSLRFADEEEAGKVFYVREAAAARPVLGDCVAENVFQLRGDYQRANLRTILCAIDELRRQPFYASCLTSEAVAEGLAHVMELTGLRGRWQQVAEAPVTVCDVGHNAAGIAYVVGQLQRQEARVLRVVFGMVDDKDYEQALTLFEQLRDRAVFYITQPSSKRALAAERLAEAAEAHGVTVLACVATVKEAVEAARADASPDDFLFIGGSCYLVADYFGT